MNSNEAWALFSEEESVAINYIDITLYTNKNEENNNLKVYQWFWSEVDNLEKLLLNTKSILVVSNSLGKDSSVTLLIALEAYRRAKTKNASFDKPLIVNTVDTLIEELPTQFYANYTIPQIKAYALRCGINLVYNQISPSRFNNWVFRYLGARKFFNNATRTGDCTDILKLAPMRKQMAKDKEHFKHYKFVQLVGSRISESSRRSGNMNKSGLKSRTMELLYSKIASTPDHVSISYAPIRNWDADDVFTCLRLAGDDAMIKIANMQPIPSFQPHAGLLLEIYGDATTPDTCQINISDEGDELSSSCGSAKIGRLGCSFCTIVTENRSAINFSKKTRWSALHIESALRIRDYIFRLSMEPNARAFHARSIDFILNRVMLQQNTLRPKILERVYRLICQLTKDSYDTAQTILNEGIENFAGYKDILEDQLMDPKTKSEYLNMYRVSAGNGNVPYNLISIHDAILLSFIWALDGVGTFSYAPIGIYDEVFEKNKRISYPPLNSELSNKVSLKSTPVLDAFVLRTMTQNFENNGYYSESLTDIIPYQDSWRGDQESTCSNSLYAPKDTLQLKVTYRYTTSDIEVIEIRIPQLNRKYLLERFQTIIDEIRKQCLEHYNNNSDSDSSSLYEATVNIRNIKPMFIDAAPSLQAKKGHLKHLNESTRRVRKGSRLTNTRLRFYPIRDESMLTYRHKKQTAMLHENPHYVQKIQVNDQEIIDSSIPLDAIELDEEIGLLYWFELDGYQRAIDTYLDERNTYIQLARRRKHYGKYNGIMVLHSMMSYGGVTIAPSYRRELERIMYRTIALHSIRAFKYADYTVTRLKREVKLGALLTMAQHRQDKARHLLNVRKARNENRMETRQHLERIEARDAFYVLEAFVKPKIVALKNSTDCESKQIQEFLTQFYRQESSHYLAFEKEFLTAEESQLLAKFPAAQKEAVRFYDETFNTHSFRETINKKINLENKATIFLSVL
ncbi:phosphoadenosine phosphosulfate reductase family protein [Vibrio vulnificus]|nr:phosphoadenosine phosphosulfate reductase family protein [Vibrio vulnificus]